MSYYKQFAEMLGLELEQEFSLVTNNGEKANSNTYKITEEGISYRVPKSEVWLSEPTSTYEYILSGDYKVVPKPLKPKKGETYWYYIDAKRVDWTYWNSKLFDLLNWKMGNCFRTEEEAETKGKEIVGQLKKEFEEA